MGVSAGFQRKIEDWMIGEDWSVAFRPFLATKNPYKARIVIAGASTQPKVEADDQFVDLLIKANDFDEYYQFSAHSRENKGVLAFANALQVPVVLSNVNTLMVNAAKELTAQKNTADYTKGLDVFREVLTEFQPELIILHGADAVKQFRKQFALLLQDDHMLVDKVQELEEVGVFAQLQLNGEKVKVLACRSLSQYGTGSTFNTFIEKINTLLD